MMNVQVILVKTADHALTALVHICVTVLEQAMKEQIVIQVGTNFLVVDGWMD